MDVLNLVLAGAALDTGNRGVEALGRSVIDTIEERAAGYGQNGKVALTVLDHDWGVRPDVSGRYQHARVECVGVRLSRRWHRPESWAQVRFAQAVSARLNPLALRLTSNW